MNIPIDLLGPSCNVISTQNQQTLTCQTASQSLPYITELIEDGKMVTTIHIRLRDYSDPALKSLQLICNDQRKCDLFVDGKAVNEKSGLNQKVYMGMVYK